MRPFIKGAPYYFPLSERTIVSLFERIFTPFMTGMSSTIVMRKGFGGGKALTRFMIDHVDDLSEKTGIPVSTATHQYVYLDPDSLPERSVDAFFRLALQELYPARTKQTYVLSRHDTHPLESVRLVLADAIRTKHVIFVIRGVNYLEFAEASFWANVRSFASFPQRVDFMFIVYDGAKISLSDGRFDRIRDVLSQNCVRLDMLSPHDVNYSIERWGYMLERKFTSSERQDISRASHGFPSLIKPCCLLVAQGVLSKDLKRHPDIIMGLKKAGFMRKIPTMTPSKKGAEGKVLRGKEQEVYEYLRKHAGKIVTRTTLASIMWPEELPEIYSEGAITNIMSRVRKGIAENSVGKQSIRTVYGKGYVLETSFDNVPGTD